MIQKFEFNETKLKGSYVIKPFFASDERGGLLKDYNVDTFKANGIEHELKEVFYSDNKDRIEDELGDLLFSVVNVARFCDCNAESALEKATKKFMRRYTEVERLAEEKNIDMKTSSIETLDKLWESVKMLE